MEGPAPSTSMGSMGQRGGGAAGVQRGMEGMHVSRGWKAGKDAGQEEREPPPPLEHPQRPTTETGGFGTGFVSRQKRWSQAQQHECEFWLGDDLRTMNHEEDAHFF